MPILVRHRLAGPLRRRPTSPMFGVYFTLRQVAGRSATVADLMQALAKLKRSDVVRWLTALSGWIDAEGGLDLPNQLTLADRLLADDLRSGLETHRRREPDIPGCVFHRRQLWFVLQMAVLVCREDVPQCPEDALRHALGECCLMASDLLQQIEPDHAPGSGAEAVNQWVASSLIPILDGKDRAEVLARAQAFWFDLAATAAVGKRIKELGVQDFDSAFSAKYGLPLRECFLIVLGLYTVFAGHALHRQSPLLVEEAAHLRPYFSEDNIRRALALVAQTPDELALQLLGGPRQNWGMDFAPLRSTPVIEVFLGKCACPDQGLLYRWLTDGIYFLLHKAYPEGQFAQLFGYVFEEYVHGLIREFACESDVLVRTFYPSPRFRGSNDQACDGLLHWHDTAVLMEYKSRLLTTREKYAGIREVTLKGIDDILHRDKQGGSKGVVQLAKSLARLLKGEPVVCGPGDGLDLAGCPHLIPAIIAYEEAVALEAVRQGADVKFRAALAKSGADADRVGPLLVLCVDDLEILEELAHKHYARQVIHDYLDHVRGNPKDRAGSFRSFVCNRGYAKDRSCGLSFVERTYQRALEQADTEIALRRPADGAEEQQGVRDELP